MKELHIPYGIHRTTREIIEPEDAIRGRACDCLCPGCEAPLLSRHPKSEDKRIHFAHDSKHPNAKPIEDCPMSPQVAFAMMARYIARNLTGKTIKLSELEKSVTFTCCLPGSSLIELIPPREAVIETAEQSVSLGGVPYDLLLTLEGKSYYIDIVYAGKPKKDLPAKEHIEGIGGIMVINANEYLAMMINPECGLMRYSESVEHFLLSYAYQDWEYHHLEDERIAGARKQHQCPPPLSRQIYDQRPRSNLYNDPYRQIGINTAYGDTPRIERTVSCFYCGQPMTTTAMKTPAMGHRCLLCAKHNRQAPHPRSPVTKESNHRANMAAEAAAKSGANGYGDIRG